MRPPRPAAVAEVLCGEPLQEAFGTVARAPVCTQCGRSCCPWWATISTRHLCEVVNLDLSPLGGVQLSKRKVGQGGSGVRSFAMRAGHGESPHILPLRCCSAPTFQRYPCHGLD